MSASKSSWNISARYDRAPNLHFLCLKVRVTLSWSVLFWNPTPYNGEEFFFEKRWFFLLKKCRIKMVDFFSKKFELFFEKISLSLYISLYLSFAFDRVSFRKFWIFNDMISILFSLIFLISVNIRMHYEFLFFLYTVNYYLFQKKILRLLDLISKLESK